MGLPPSYIQTQDTSSKYALLFLNPTLYTFPGGTVKSARRKQCKDFMESSIVPFSTGRQILFSMGVHASHCFPVHVVCFDVTALSGDVILGSQRGRAFLSLLICQPSAFPKEGPNCTPPSLKNSLTGSTLLGQKHWFARPKWDPIVWKKMFYNVYWTRTFSSDYCPFVSCPLALRLGNITFDLKQFFMD